MKKYVRVTVGIQMVQK